jgi:site-specific DNA-methyltransferase (adenine-specific)
MHELRLGDIREVATNLPTINCVVTSPPYFQQRDYGVDAQLGQELTIPDYVDNLVETFHSIKDHMPDTGTLFLNLGDRYKYGHQLGIPWHTVLGLMNDKWILKNDIIWMRNRIMPESTTNRFTRCHEYVFFLTLKPSKYTFNAQDVREIAKWAHDKRAGKGRHVYCESRGAKAHTAGVTIAADGKRNRRSVWTIETSQTKGQHSATFPLELPEICILAGSNPGDMVLDPFMGTGTTGIAALKHNRSFIGVDVSQQYIDIAADRIDNFIREED